MSDDETRAQLASLKASATQQYSLKNYSAAAEFYSEATELQANLHGEMSPENADLLYAYGRCLYHVAVSQSDVLGGKVASGEEPKKKKRKTQASGSTGKGDALKSGEEKTVEEVVETIVEETDGMEASKAGKEATNKPFFQITGDENWTDSEDEDEDAEDAQNGEEEEDDDFAIAYEILDVARVLLGRKLEALEQETQQSAGKGKGKAIQDENLSPESRTIMERLADTHDLQAEISLENERFMDAVTDSRSALEFKKRLFPQESSLVAEAHFKLSLALEFASVTTVQADGEAATEGHEQAAQVDEAARQEAAEEMEAAIASCKLRVTKEKAAIAELEGDQKNDKQKSIKDVEEMITDMEQRVSHHLLPQACDQVLIRLTVARSSKPSCEPERRYWTSWCARRVESVRWNLGLDTWRVRCGTKDPDR